MKTPPPEIKRFRGGVRQGLYSGNSIVAILVVGYYCKLMSTRVSPRRLLQDDLGLFLLDGSGFAVPSFQLHPVFGSATERVPSNDATSHFVGFGDKSWDNSKNFFQTQGFEFLFLSQRARQASFGGSIAPKTPVLKLNRPLV